jgi:beta-lactamase regulating signal transducer with metallopeptidase domain
MTAANEAVLSIANLAGLLVKLTILLSGAALAAAVLRRRSAALRHRLWAAAVFSALLLPLLTFMIPAKYATAAGIAAPGWVSGIGLAEGHGAMTPSARAAGSPHFEVSSIVLFEALVVFVWGIGFIFAASRLAAGFWRLSRTAAGSKRVEDAAWRQSARELSGSLGIRRPVRLRECDLSEQLPFTYGTFRPSILLPTGAGEWSPERRRAVLAHELAHVRRRDWLVQISAEFLCCLYWFHPLAWLASRKLRQEGDQACDDSAINSGIPAGEYAEELLNLARACCSIARGGAAVLAIVHSSNFERRLKAMLTSATNRKPLSRKTAASIAILSLAVLLPVTAVHLGAQNQVSMPAPKGWWLSESKSQNYLTGIDPGCSHQGLPCAYLKGKPTATEGFGTLTQKFSASDYLGKRVRFTAWVKSENVNSWAGLWMRVDKDLLVLGFDNMQNRAIKGTTDWRQYSVVLDVPNYATAIAFGILLDQSGEVWLNGVKFETVSADVPVTGEPSSPLPQGPDNLDFRQ